MRPKRATDEIGEFDLDFDPSISAAKLPTDVTGGMEAISDFMTVPCEKLVPYQSKRDSDFMPLSEEKFRLLVESVQENGVIEPVIVRPLKGDRERFELLAGEHRWKASMVAGLTTIPAHILRKCDDKTAADIFAITNLVRRENSIRDKVNGWWHYTQAIHYKRGRQIQQMLDEGILDREVHEEAKSSMRQVYRYANLHRLIDSLMDMVENKRISIVAAEQLSYLNENQQGDLLNYKSYLNNLTKCRALRNLARRENGEMWNIHAVEEILLPKGYSESTSKTVSRAVLDIMRRKLNRKSYSVIPMVLENALDELLREHPEYGK